MWVMSHMNHSVTSGLPINMYTASYHESWVSVSANASHNHHDSCPLAWWMQLNCAVNASANHTARAACASACVLQSSARYVSMWVHPIRSVAALAHVKHRAHVHVADQ